MGRDRRPAGWIRPDGPDARQGKGQPGRDRRRRHGYDRRMGKARKRGAVDMGQARRRGTFDMRQAQAIACGKGRAGRDAAARAEGSRTLEAGRRGMVRTATVAAFALAAVLGGTNWKPPK